MQSGFQWDPNPLSLHSPWNASQVRPREGRASNGSTLQSPANASKFDHWKVGQASDEFCNLLRTLVTTTAIDTAYFASIQRKAALIAGALWLSRYQRQRVSSLHVIALQLCRTRPPSGKMAVQMFIAKYDLRGVYVWSWCVQLCFADNFQGKFSSLFVSSVRDCDDSSI